MTDLDGIKVVLVLDESEIASIASEMARAYADFVQYYRKECGLTPEEADKKTQELIEGSKSPPLALTMPPDQVDWWHLSEFAEHEPEKIIEIWEKVKHAAREELASGHRAAKAVQGLGRS